MTWATRAIPTRTSQDRDSNEATNEGQVEDDPDPSKPLRAASLESELHEHRDEGVGDSGREDTFDGAIGCACATNGADDLVEAG